MESNAKPVRQLADCDDHFERKVVGDVEGPGWTVIAITQEGSSPAYAFTIGLQHRFGHPELVVVGLPRDRSATLLNEMGRRVKEGEQFEAGQLYGDLVETFQCRVDVVPAAQHREYLGFCRWFYRGDGFSAVQIVWPDSEHRFPDDPQFSERLRAAQPLLSG